MKQGIPETPSPSDWLRSEKVKCIGIDPKVTSLSFYDEIKSSGAQIVPLEDNPIDLVWGEERPSIPTAPVFVHPIEFAGEDVESKISKVRSAMEKHQCRALVVSALDEIAWLFNLRGSDIAFNPVFLSYAIVTHEDVFLFVDSRKVEEETVKEHLKTVNVMGYDSVFDTLTSLGCFSPELQLSKVWMDPSTANMALKQCVAEPNLFLKSSPIALLKAVKNSTELEGMRNCHLRDAAAKISFIHWLQESLLAGKTITEFDAASVLESFRSRQKHFMGLSFDTISSSGPNGAIIHYKPTKDNCRTINPSEVYLVDSGAQFKDGTTDITRTMHFGTPTQFQKQCFTQVLQGHMALASAVFPQGTKGPALDTLARKYLWESGLNFNHGTGHGVGSFLNVHEGPHGISSTVNNKNVQETALVPGMIVTDEPGYYHEGDFGIRIESILIVKEVQTEHQFGGKSFLGFENISLVPIDKNLIEMALLSSKEIEWINAFHAECLEKVGPLLSGAPLEWLRNACTPL